MVQQPLSLVQVSKEHYSPKYDHKARWLSYWHQIQEVLKLSPATVAEIGIGNGLISWYLERNGISVSTIDIDDALKPNIVASVTSIPLSDNSFDVVLCSEVLEHLEFDESKKALKELYRVCKNGAVISVPDSRRTLFRVQSHIPFFGTKEFLIKFDTQRRHKFDGQHFWEIGKKGYSLKVMRSAIYDAGFKIIRDFAPVDVPTKHFFILSK